MNQTTNAIWLDSPENQKPPLGRDNDAEKTAREYRQKRLLEIAALLAKRRLEGLTLAVPLFSASEFFSSHVFERILDGSNQSSKTFHAALEATRVICNADPYNKYPKTGTALFLGLNEDHLGTPMFAKMYRPGEFQVIRDEQTRLWRAVRPDPNDPTHLDPYDLAYKEKWKDAPPLLPERYIKGKIGWHDASKEIPHVIRTTVGWECLWNSSEAKPRQGSLYDYAWFDEHIERESFYNETIRGLGRKKGKFVWSATPQTINPQIVELRERAEKGDPDVLAIKLLIADNPYIPDDSKRRMYNAWSEEERLVRWHGQSAISGKSVYDYRAMSLHGCEPRQIPDDWSHYAIVDPGGGGGSSHVGNVHLAVDPDEKHVWVYDAFDMAHADADKWADALRRKQPRNGYEAIIMDQQAGQQCPFASSKTVAQQYWEALARADVVPHAIGPMHGFMRGSKDVRAREEALKSWFTVREHGIGIGTPRLQIFRGMSSKLDRQIGRAHNEDNGKRSKKYPEDLLVCLEYAAGYNPRYVDRTGPPASSRPSPVLELLKKLDRKKKPHVRTF
jgi:hypothetical protein